MACEEFRPLVLAGLECTADYQDRRYAILYWQRLRPFANLASGGGCDECNLFCAAARELALGMTYPDFIRLAELRLRALRIEKAQAKPGAGGCEISGAEDLIHLSSEEIADALPFGLGRRTSSGVIVKALLRRACSGRPRVGAPSLAGCLLLYFAASLKPWRRGSLRFARETQSIEDWLDTVWAAAKRDLKLAASLAQARCLLRGYGDAYARGVQKFDAICDYARSNKFAVSAENVNALIEAAQAAPSARLQA